MKSTGVVIKHVATLTVADLGRCQQVMPIELPGRGLRIKEARHTCVQSLVHSMLLAISPLLQYD